MLSIISITLMLLFGSSKVVIVLAMEVIRGEMEIFPYSIYEKKKS